MANFDISVAKTLIREGGAKFTNISDDKGGATKYGISQASYPDLDIRNLTESQAREIYKRDYWDVVRADDINSQEVAENIFDTAVNMGARTTSKLAQACCGVSPDGKIGQITIAEINKCDEFIAKFTIVKIARYADICNRDRSQSKFLLGWINRALGGEA